MSQAAQEVPRPHPWRLRLLLLVPAAAFLLALYAHWDGLTEPYRVNNDAHQHTFWLHWAGDGAAIEGDLTAYYASRYEPPAWVWLYRALAPLIEPAWLGRLLPLLLFPLSALLLFLVADRVDGRAERFPWPAVLAVGLFFISPFFLRKMAGGHPRAFATPFLLGTLYLLQRSRDSARHAWPLAGLLVAQSVVYPIAWLLSAATVCGSWLRLSRKPPRLRFERLAVVAPVLAGLVLGGLLLLGRYGAPPDPRLGEPFTRAELAADPALAAQLQRGGRTSDLPVPGLLAGYRELIRGDLLRLRPAWSSAWPRRLHPRLYPVLVLALVLFAVQALRRRLPFPPELLALTLASVALYLIADLLLARLLLPRRYIMYSLSLVTVIALALLAGRTLPRLPPWLRRAALTALAALLALFAPGIKNFALDDYSPWAGAFQIARALPEDALLAAPPYVADGIPLFAQRHVLINYQMALPYLPTYWHQIEPRLNDLVAAYYATDLPPLVTLRDRHGVTYLLVDQREFDRTRIQSKQGVLFEPWRSQIQERAQRTNRFLLEDWPKAQRLHESEDGRFFAIDLRRLAP